MAPLAHQHRPVLALGIRLGAIAALSTMAMMSKLAMLKTQRHGLHAKRAVAGTIGMLCNFGAVILLPLAEATTMGFTAAIWAVILSALLLKDRIGPWRWGAVLLGFLGVLVIA